MKKSVMIDHKIPPEVAKNIIKRTSEYYQFVRKAGKRKRHYEFVNKRVVTRSKKVIGELPDRKP